MYLANDPRENIIIHVLLEMTQGNFYHEMEIADKTDVLATIMFLINKINEESHSYLTRQAFIPAREMSHYLYPVIFTLDEKGVIENVNKHASKALEQDKKKIIGKNFTEFMTEDSKDLWRKQYKRIIKKKVEDSTIHLEFLINEDLLLSRNFFVFGPYPNPKGDPKTIVGTVLYSPRETLGKGIWGKTKGSDEHPIIQKPKITFKDVQIAKMVNEYMEENLQKGIPDHKTLALLHGTNENKLKKSFKILFKKSISQHFQAKRIHEAKKLLLDSDMKIITIAQRVGFNDQGHFARVFKKKVGKTPTDFRKGGQ